LALLALAINLPLSAYAWIPLEQPALILVPLIETLGLLWILLAISTFVRRKETRIAVHAVLGAIFGLLLGFSIAESFFRYYYARSFMPLTDIAMLRGALLLFFGDIGILASILTPVLATLIFIALGVVGYLGTRGLEYVISRLPRPRIGLGVLTVVAIPIMLLVGLPASLSALTAFSWFDSGRSDFVAISADVPNSANETTVTPSITGAEEEAQVRYTFPGLLDRDIYIFAVEAYGYAAFHRPELDAALQPERSRLAEALETKGYGVVTNFLRSPVAGGYSWLAEASLFTGQWIDSQDDFQRLYDAELPSLTGMLQQGGYYTLSVRPGTIHGEWPEGWDLYRFEESIISYNDGFNYEGPWFSFVPVTDQYAIWTGHRRIRELRSPDGEGRDRPILAHYQLVSSHTPYNRIPPIIEDWSALGDGSIYNKRSEDIERFDNTWSGGTELDEGFIAAQTYVLRVITDYVERIMDHGRNPIIIIFGDHQPQRPIRSPQAELSVPFHVASRDAEVLRLFENEGYSRGMEGGQPPPHEPMSAFFPMFSELARTPARPSADLAR
jgi:hypothetical protein